MARRGVKRPADIAAEDRAFVANEKNADLVRDALVKLLSHRSKAVRQATEGALAQAKEAKRRPDPERLKALLKRDWKVHIPL